MTEEIKENVIRALLVLPTNKITDTTFNHTRLPGTGGTPAGHIYPSKEGT